MTQRIISFSVFLIICCSGFASTIDKLTGKDWELQFNSGKHPSEGFRFSETEIFYFWHYNGRKETATPYYLSDTIDTVFDKSKIGKLKDGKYIISYPRFRATPDEPWENIIVVFKINILTDSVLQLVDTNTYRYCRTYKAK